MTVSGSQIPCDILDEPSVSEVIKKGHVVEKTTLD